MHKTPFFPQKALLVISGLFAAVVLLEAFLRLGGLVFSSIQERRNLQSLRHKGAYRIMCLGESTTAGQYPSFLEEALNQRNIGVQFSVIDKGLGGAKTPVILAHLESNLDTYKPDMVIAMMGMNDQRIIYYKDVPSAHTRLFQRLRSWRFLSILYSRVSARMRASAKPASQKEGFSENEEKLKKAIELNPKNARAYVELGRFYRAQGKPAQAEGAFKKALELAPRDDDTYLQLGWSCREQGKPSEAESSFKKAIEVNPQSDNAYVELGRVYRNQGEPSRVEDSFKKAIELNPKNERAYVELGRFYRAQGKPTQAEAAFKKVLELDPQDGLAYVELAWSYQTQGKPSEAEACLKKAIELNPKNDHIYGVLAVLYEEMGKPSLAKVYAAKAVRLRVEQLNPITVQSYRTLKDILDRKGIRLVCMQYPMRSPEPLKNIFESCAGGIIFIDNEQVFRDAVKKDGYSAYFRDAFAGDFGHCTPKGNKLLAANIANAILKEAFHK